MPAAATPDRSEEIGLRLLGATGIGLVGPGASEVLRCLVLTLLAQHGTQAEIIISGTDAINLLGRLPSGDVPGLITTSTLRDALRRLELCLVERARREQEQVEEPSIEPLLVMVAAPEPALNQQIDTLLAQGQDHQIAGLLFGPWPTGATIALDEDGHITHADHPAFEPLIGSPLFGLKLDDAADLLDLLQAASADIPDRPTDQPPPQNAPTTAARPSRRAPSDRKARTAAPQPHPVPPRPQPESPKVKVSLLGPIAITGPAGQPIRPRRRTAYELLAYLAVHRDGASAEMILNELWPADQRGQARHRLRDAATAIRTSLRPLLADRAAETILVSSARYRINPDLFTIDLWQLQTAAARADAASEPADRLAALQAAAETYTGPFAADRDWAWAHAVRKELTDKIVEILAATAGLLEPDDLGKAIDALSRASDIDPTNESLHQQLMHLHAKNGDTHAVHATYERLRTCLAELDTRPSSQTEQALRILTER